MWDGLYSTLWGDAFCAGNRMLNSPPWSYDLIVGGVALAMLPTLAILIGGVAAVARFIRKPSPAWVFLLGLAFTVLLAILSMTMTVPSCARPRVQPKRSMAWSHSCRFVPWRVWGWICSVAAGTGGGGCYWRG